MRLATFTRGDNSFSGTTSLSHTKVVASGWVFSRRSESPLESTEVEQLFESQGPDFTNALDGQYCAVVASPRDETIYACGDCGGLYPWYAHGSEGIAWVSSSAMALASGLRLSLNYETVQSLLLGVPARSPASLFREVRRMPYGERATLSAGRLRTKTYWHPSAKVADYKSLQEAAEAGTPLLKRTCQQVLRQFKAPVCDLTSGLDTRLLVAVMSMSDIPFATTVSGAQGHIDVRGAEEITRKMGWPIVRIQPPSDWGKQRFRFFHEAVRSMDGEISAQLCDTPQWCKHLLKKDFDASATGGGGELFREFPWEHLILKAGKTSQVNVDSYISLRLPTRKMLHSELFERDWTFSHHEAKRSRIQQIIDQSPESLNTQKLDAVYLWRSSGHFGRYSGGLSTIIPSPMPLMGRDVLEFCLAVPARFRRAALLIREMITRANPQLAGVWTCWGGSAKPMGIRHPLRSLPYWNATVQRWTRKIGQRSIGSTILPDPFYVNTPRTWDDDFVSVIRERGLLDASTWNSAGLYTDDGLCSFLTHATGAEFGSHSLLYAMLTIELACRDCGIVAKDAI